MYLKDFIKPIAFAAAVVFGGLLLLMLAPFLIDLLPNVSSTTGKVIAFILFAMLIYANVFWKDPARLDNSN